MYDTSNLKIGWNDVLRDANGQFWRIKNVGSSSTELFMLNRPSTRMVVPSSWFYGQTRYFTIVGSRDGDLLPEVKSFARHG
jgi:hypothetical protein